MPFDRERYEREVLEPARARGNEPPADLAVRYALTSELLRNPSQFQAHVAEMANYWGTLKRFRKYARLADALLVAHSQLDQSGRLSPAAIDEQRRQAHERLVARVSDLAVTTTCVSPATLQALMHESGLGPAAVRAALLKQGLRVVELCALATEPPTPKYRDLHRNLLLLGMRLSAEAVFGDRVRAGFRLLDGFALTTGAGERLDAASIAAAGRRLESARHDDRKTAAANVLALLQAQSQQAGALDALLLWEMAEALRGVPLAPPSQLALAREAAELGLERGEAEVLALTVIESGPLASRPARGLEVQEALEEGRLRHAQQLAATLTEEGAGPLRASVEAAAGRVAELSAEADRARAEGRDEDAATLLAEAVRLARDDEDLQERLRAIPPPAPTGVRQSIDGGRVTVSWRPSMARTGAVRYRAVRGEGRPPRAVQDGVDLGVTEGNELVDATPPAGPPLFHSVFATRDGKVWSAPACAGPALITPEVGELRLHADGRSVTGSWHPHPGTAEVLVVRSEQGPPRTRMDGRPVRQVSLLGFSDTDVRLGMTYHYRVSAVYLGPDGSRHVSPGLVASITAEEVPAAVTDLAVAVLPGSQTAVQATWTPPAGGMTRIWLGQQPPRWQAGAEVRPGDLPSLGSEVLGAPERLPDGRARLIVPAGPLRGRCFFTAVTVGRSGAVVGNSVELLVAAPVRELAAQRFAGVVRLSWIWPDRSTLARVRWRRLEETGGGEIECSRKRYEDQGGFEMAVGPDAIAISVQAVIQQSGSPVAAVPVEVQVEALGRPVRYGIRRQGFRGRRLTLVLEVDGPCDLPSLVLVRRAGTILPLRPEQGAVVARVPAQRLDAAQPLEIPLDLPPGQARLRLFPQPPGGVTLLDPPARELEVR